MSMNVYKIPVRGYFEVNTYFLINHGERMS